MKLSDKITRKPIPLEINGEMMYMQPLTLAQLKHVQAEIGKIEDNSEDLSPLMVLFTHVLVDEDGKVYDEIADGATFEQICEVVPIQYMLDIVKAVSQKLLGDNLGN